MKGSHIETEHTFELPEGAGLPDLGLDGTTVRAKPRRLSLHATYHDTDDLRLARAQVTLRRREGGEDDGWHLKLPAGSDRRREVQRPLGRTSVPVPLRRALTPLTLGQPLLPVVDVRTTRIVHRISDLDGTLLAEVAEDDVTVLRSDDPEKLTAWREIEVELIGGGDHLLEHLGARLIDAGAWVSDHPSKLRRALGSTVPPRHSPPTGLGRASAGAALWDYLSGQVELLTDREVEVRLGLRDGVHQMRITARRIRSALAVCRPLLDEATGRHLEAELRWLGQQLGDVRDLEVMQARLLAAVAAESAPAPARAMTATVRASLRRDERVATSTARETLDLTRRMELQSSLEALLAAPPFTDRATKKAPKVLDRRIGKTWRRLTDAVAAAEAAEGVASDKALHDVRKAAKRLRYAAEMATPTLGKPADLLRARAQAVQKALGEHQDSVVAREWHQRLSREAKSSAAAFGFGRLHALEQITAAEARAAYESSVDTLRTVSSLR